MKKLLAAALLALSVAGCAHAGSSFSTSGSARFSAPSYSAPRITVAPSAPRVAPIAPVVRPAAPLVRRPVVAVPMRPVIPVAPVPYVSPWTGFWHGYFWSSMFNHPSTVVVAPQVGEGQQPVVVVHRTHRAAYLGLTFLGVLVLLLIGVGLYDRRR